MKNLLSIAIFSLVTFSACAGSRFTYNQPAKPVPAPVVVAKPALPPVVVKGLPAKSVAVIFDQAGYMAIGSATFTVYGPAPTLGLIIGGLDIAELQSAEGL